MTKGERAQLVELLRCAADIAIDGDRGAALGIAARHVLDLPWTVPALRSMGWEDWHWCGLLRGNGPVHDQPHRTWRICGQGYEFCLLEAAQRIEEGSWP